MDKKNINLVRKECDLIMSVKNSKSLKERILEIKLSKTEEDEIRINKSKNLLKDKFLDSFKVGKIINTIIKWNKDIDNEVSKEKERILISSLFDEFEKEKLKLDTIINLFNNPYGQILTRKIFEVANQSPPDKELLNYLTLILKNIAKSDFVSLFTKHSFFINLLDQLPIQSLFILNDSDNWSIIEGSYSVSSGHITTPWVEKFSRSYIENKGLDKNDINIFNMINYSVLILQTNNIVISHNSQKSKGRIMVLTELGKEFVRYFN
ncbi:hypothetical protein [Tenacibaculum dicentrarchi]|uniref:hypothetical protein n=1 Tax=Tenacibaculum dicentrarchi TaxID=669041 RepID=UPI0035140FE3